MAYITIQVNATHASVADMNQLLLAGDSTKPREIIRQIVDFLEGVEGGCDPSSITATSSTNTGTVSGQTGGVSVTLNLT